VDKLEKNNRSYLSQAGQDMSSFIFPQEFHLVRNPPPCRWAIWSCFSENYPVVVASGDTKKKKANITIIERNSISIRGLISTSSISVYKRLLPAQGYYLPHKREYRSHPFCIIGSDLSIRCDRTPVLMGQSKIWEGPHNSSPIIKNIIKGLFVEDPPPPRGFFDVSTILSMQVGLDEKGGRGEYSEFIERLKKYDDDHESFKKKEMIVDKVRSLLGLKEWDIEYDVKLCEELKKLKKLVEQRGFQRGRVIKVPLRKDVAFPCVVVCNPLLIAISGKIIILPMIDWREEHENTGIHYCVELPSVKGGLEKKSINLLFLQTIQTTKNIHPWKPNWPPIDMKKIDENLELLLAQAK